MTTEDQHPEPVEIDTNILTEDEPQQVEVPRTTITREQMAILVGKIKRKLIKEDQRNKRVKNERKKKKNIKKQRKHLKNRGK